MKRELLVGLLLVAFVVSALELLSDPYYHINARSTFGFGLGGKSLS